MVEQEADAIVLFVPLEMAVREDLVVSYQGKPCDRNVHH